jgi:hypothetical protein
MVHTDYIELGPVPAGESCAQVGADNYLANSLRECEVFKRLLARLFPIPEGLPVAYVVRSHPHDFGTYREVSVRFQGDHQAAIDFACKVEANSPENWDAIASYELAWFERRDLLSRAIREGALTEGVVAAQYVTNRMPTLDPKARFAELLQHHPL